MTGKVAVPAYFTCIGFGINLYTEIDITLVLVFFVWSSVLKIGSVWFVIFLVSRSATVALDHAIAMNTRGGPGLVLAATAYSTGVIGLSTFLALVVTSILTAVVSQAYLSRASARISSECAMSPHTSCRSPIIQQS